MKTGEPADGTVAVTFSRLPSWIYLLLLAGIFPFLIALMFAGETIHAQVPIRQNVLDVYHGLGRKAWASYGIAAACGVVAVVSDAGWIWWPAAISAVVGAAIFTRRAVGWVRARPIPDTSLVALHGVHAAFATALEEDQGAPR